MSANSIQVITSLVTAFLAFTGFVLALIVFISQQKSEKHFKAIFQALVVVGLVAIPGDRSVGETLLRFIRLNRHASELIEEAGARILIQRARDAGHLRPDDWEAIQREWPEVFGKPWSSQ